MSYPPGTIIRYSTASRINHWITAICFTLLVLSGLSMFHPLLFWLSSQAVPLVQGGATRKLSS